ncbi:hypothetical protein ACTJN4_15025 [Citrobacter freundii]|uniref:hypothetical protein n=1 Tax=Citrobacter freundii TaxID=546 RepID=UPI003F899BBE
MSEVKIYTVVSDELSPPVIGESFCTDMVRHSDYAALEKILTDMAVQLANAESKCRELAAENAGLKDAAEFATAPDMWEDLGGNVMRYQYQEWYADRLKSAMKTPATDAFLAEVRASALEYYANLFKDTVNMDVKHNQEFHKGTLYVADQLRNGGTAQSCPHCGAVGTCSEHGCTATDQMIERYRASQEASQ